MARRDDEAHPDPDMDPVDVLADVGRRCDGVGWVVTTMSGIIDELNTILPEDIQFHMFVGERSERPLTIYLRMTPTVPSQQNPVVAGVTCHEDGCVVVAKATLSISITCVGPGDLRAAIGRAMVGVRVYRGCQADSLVMLIP